MTKVKVEFPDGVRELEPEAWTKREGQTPRPIFPDSRYEIIETVDGRYIAVDRK